jgi:phosphodiesterase/alkaline phosphatase D-like protein
MRARGLTLTVLVVLGGLLLGSGVAQASSTAFVEVSGFGREGTGAGEFKGPTGVAVEQSTGDVYVVDGKNLRVQKFGPAGEFILAFGKAVDETTGADICTAASHDVCKAGSNGAEPGQFGEVLFFGTVHLGGPAGVAVDSETGDVYVADRFNRRIEKFSSGGAYLGQFSGSGTPAGAFSEAFGGPGAGGVAVDPVLDAVHGGHDVYVADAGNNVVDVFDSAGVYLRQLTGVPGVAFSGPDGVAFDSGGDAYVLDRGNRAVDEFAGGEGPGVRLTLEAELEEDGEAIALDAVGDVFVDEHSGGTAHVIEFSPTGKVLVREFGNASAEGLDPSDVAVDPSRKTAYLSGGYLAVESGDKVGIFEEQTGEPPGVVTGAASVITPTSAMLAGTVKPESHATDYWFKYGLDETYSSGCGAGGCTTPRTFTVSMTGEEAVSASLEGLEPHKTYHYRLVAKSVFGEVEGKDKTFTTLSKSPTVESETAQNLFVGEGATEESLSATVNPNNEVTHYYFEYGTSPTLAGASRAPVLPGELPAAGVGVGVEQKLQGLRPNTVYYYRAVAENGTPRGGGEVPVPIQEFRTLPPLPSASTAEASSITDSSATIAGAVNPGSSGPNSETQYYFEYSTTETPAGIIQSGGIPEECRQEAGCYEAPSSPQQAGGAEGGESSLAVQADLAALKPFTTYHYRVVAFDHPSSFFGGLRRATYGADKTFTTLPVPPVVETDLPATVGAGSATLTGVVMLEGGSGSYHFKYGTGASYGSSTPASEALAGGGQHAVMTSITGLQPESTYHYVLVASNLSGTIEGEERTFTTGHAPTGAEPLPAGFSLVGAPFGAPAAVTSADLTSLTPTPSPKATPSKPSTSKTFTRAQKLSKALHACKKQPKKKRAGCEAKARKTYGSAHKAKKSDRRSN